MYTVTINEEKYTIKNDISEFTIEEFEDVSAILNNPKYDSIQRYLELLKYLKLDEDIIDSLDSEEFLKIVESFSMSSLKSDDKYTLKRTIELNGFIYESYDSDSNFKLKVKDLSLIEKAIKSNNDKYFSDIISILFKRTDLTKKEHYSDAHLAHKKELFKTLKCEDFYSYIIYINKRIVDKIKMTDEKL